VLRDGVEINPAALGSPLLVDPGAHVLLVEMSGRPPQRTEVTLREGEEKVIEVAAGPTSSSSKQIGDTAEPPQAATSSEGGSTRRTLMFVTAGVGVAGLTAGAITGLMTVNAASTYRARCTNGECDSEGLAAASTGRTTSIVSPVAFAVGGVFAIASVYLFVSSPSSKPGKGARVLFTPTALREGGGLSLSGVF